MKRNGFLNLLRVTFKDFLYEKKMYEEVVPRNFFHALQMNSFSIDRTNDKDAETIYLDLTDGSELNEITIEYFDVKGGIIVFSTDINAVELSKNKLVNYIYSKVKSIKNALLVNQKINKVIKKHESQLKGIGLTIGNFVKGRYVSDNDTIFDEKSISVEIIGLETSVLNEVANSLRLEFNQESVLVKNYEDNKTYLIK
jgi:hypothetical protein